MKIFKVVASFTMRSLFSSVCDVVWSLCVCVCMCVSKKEREAISQGEVDCEEKEWQ